MSITGDIYRKAFQLEDEIKRLQKENEDLRNQLRQEENEDLRDRLRQAEELQ